MDRGYVKQWRKETDSDIWDMPPLFYKVWRYLLMEADRNTGVLTISGPQLAEYVQWTENKAIVRPDRKTIARILHYLESTGSLVTEISGNSSRRFYRITICNWSTYQSNGNGLVTEDPADLPQKTDSLQEVGSCSTLAVSGRSVGVQPSCPERSSAPQEEDSSKKDKLKQLHETYPQIADLLKTKWLCHAELPKSSQTVSAKFKIADTIRMMHTIDKCSWDQIGKVLDYAARVWVPKGFIGSPASLRTMGEDRMKHETIWMKIEAESSNDGLEEGEISFAATIARFK